MDRFLPLTSNNTDQPVLHIDTEAPLDFVFACADRRIRMARYLLDCAETVDEDELRHMAHVARLLLVDGCDALSVVEKHVSRLVQREDAAGHR
jgi:hypothetical protein